MTTGDWAAVAILAVFYLACVAAAVDVFRMRKERRRT